MPCRCARGSDLQGSSINRAPAKIACNFNQKIVKCVLKYVDQVLIVSRIYGVYPKTALDNVPVPHV